MGGRRRRRAPADPRQRLPDTRASDHYHGSTVQALALDPTDWHSAFVVDRNGRIWNGVTNEDGSSVTWTQLTGNLKDFTTDLRTITVLGGGSNLVLLVGGQGGVYRTLNPRYSSPTWSKFGANLPNAPVTDLRYDSTNDVLLAGTLGRGAWTIPNLSSSVMLSGKLEVDGDLTLSGPDDHFRLVLDPHNPLLLDVRCSACRCRDGAHCAGAFPLGQGFHRAARCDLWGPR